MHHHTALDRLLKLHENVVLGLSSLLEVYQWLSCFQELTDTSDQAFRELTAGKSPEAIVGESLCDVLRRFAIAERTIAEFRPWLVASTTPALPRFRYRTASQGRQTLFASSYHELVLALKGVVFSDIHFHTDVHVLSGGEDSAELVKFELPKCVLPSPVAFSLLRLLPELDIRLKQEMYKVYITLAPELPSVELNQACLEVRYEDFGDQRKPAQPRNVYFWKLDQEGKVPSEIRDHWNSLSDGQRRKICPMKSGTILDGEQGIDSVKKGIQAARQLLEKMASSHTPVDHRPSGGA